MGASDLRRWRDRDDGAATAAARGAGWCQMTDTALSFRPRVWSATTRRWVDLRVCSTRSAAANAIADAFARWPDHLSDSTIEAAAAELPRQEVLAL